MAAHLFSLYAPCFFKEPLQVAQQLVIQDDPLVHRMTKVLRFAVDDVLVLFDQVHHAQVAILSISKKQIIVQIQKIEKNQLPEPKVTFLLPLLKRDALEQAIYALCELGVFAIQLIITQSSRKQLLNQKEFDRLCSIVIAAAEQSKHYSISQLLQPENISKVLEREKYDQKIVFDAAGKSFFDISCNQTFKGQHIALLIGPEAGLSDVELAILSKFQFQFCALTASTLRAVQAACLGAGLFLLQR